MLMTTAASAQTYKLVWADEFDNNTLGTNWNIEVTGNPANNELQYYTSRQTGSHPNVEVKDGNLVLTGRRESYGGRSFTSGRVNSAHNVNFTHGMVVARIKLPKTKRGLWPAFWMMGDDISQYGWPYCGEIDILEAGHSQGYGGREETYFSGAIHWGQDWRSHAYYSTSYNAPYSVEDDYHIFTAVWTDELLSCYLDQATKPYFQASIGTGFDAEPYMHKPFHILFNLAIGGDFPGITNPSGITALPNAGDEAQMLVDYVRVYQLENDVVFEENDADKVSVKELTPPEQKQEIAEVGPAPTPRQPAEQVRSLYSNHYASVGKNPFFETWGSPGESVTTVLVAEGDPAQKVERFGWLGFNFNAGYAATDMSGMDYLHIDIFPSKACNIGITPISHGPQEYDEIYYPLMADRWNSIDCRLADYRQGNPSIDYSKAFQVKWFGGDQSTSLYIDNIFFYSGEPTGINIMHNEECIMHNAPSSLISHPSSVYDLQGRKVASLMNSEERTMNNSLFTNHYSSGQRPKPGIYIIGGKKIVIK